MTDFTTQENQVHSKTLGFDYSIITMPEVNSFVMKAAQRGVEWETFLCKKFKTLDFVQNGAGDRTEPPLCLNVGSYIGSHSIPLAMLGYDVIGFEIISRMRDICRANVLANGLEHKVTIRDGGLWNKNTTETAKTAYTGTSSIDRKLDEYKYEEQTDLWRLDDLNLNIGDRRIEFIKIDVEGGEFKVFDGADRTIRAHRPTIAVEVFNTTRNHRLLEEFCKRYDYTSEKLKSTDYWLTPNDRTCDMPVGF